MWIRLLSWRLLLPLETCSGRRQRLCWMRPRRSGCTHSPFTGLGSLGLGHLDLLLRVLWRGIETPSGLVPWNRAPPGVLDGCGRGFPNIRGRSSKGTDVLGIGQQSPASAPDGAHPLELAFSITQLNAWLRCTSCPWVMSTLEFRYRLQFRVYPPRFRGILETPVKGVTQSAIMANEISYLVGEGCNTASVSKGSKMNYSPYFLVPKWTGGFRPILDLRQLNKHLKVLPFRMLRLGEFFQAIRPGDWFTTVDLCDAYFHIPISQDHRKFLRFSFRGRAFEYKVLPFGLSLSPQTFTKCMDAALVPLRQKGIRVLNYLDDWLVCASSEVLAQSHTEAVLAHLVALGLQVNAEKSCLAPARSVEYLGLTLDSSAMKAYLTLKRRRGAVWDGRTARGNWGTAQQGWHINHLEMEAVCLALRHFLPVAQGRQVLVQTDSTAVVAYINRQGGLRSPSLHARVRQLLLWTQSKKVVLRAFYLPGPQNVAADLLSPWQVETARTDRRPDLVLLWSGTGGPFYHIREHPLSSVVINAC